MYIEFYCIGYKHERISIQDEKHAGTIAVLSKKGYSFSLSTVGGSNIMVRNSKGALVAVITNYYDWKHLHRI